MQKNNNKEIIRLVLDECPSLIHRKDCLWGHPCIILNNIEKFREMINKDNCEFEETLDYLLEYHETQKTKKEEKKKREESKDE